VDSLGNGDLDTPKEKGEIFRVTQQIEKLRGIVVPGTIEEINGIAEEASSIYMMGREQTLPFDKTQLSNTPSNLKNSTTKRCLFAKKEERPNINEEGKEGLLDLLCEGDSMEDGQKLNTSDQDQRVPRMSREGKKTEDKKYFLKRLTVKSENPNERFSMAGNEEVCVSDRIKGTFDCLDDKTRLLTQKSRTYKCLDGLMKNLPRPTAPVHHDFFSKKVGSSKKGSLTVRRSNFGSPKEKHTDLTVLKEEDGNSNKILKSNCGSRNPSCLINAGSHFDRGQMASGLFGTEEPAKSIRDFIEKIQESEELPKLLRLNLEGNLCRFISEIIQLFLIFCEENGSQNAQFQGRYSSSAKSRPTTKPETLFQSVSKVSQKRFTNIFPGCSVGLNFNKKIEAISQRADSVDRNKENQFHEKKGVDSRPGFQKRHSPTFLKTSVNKDGIGVLHSKIFFSGNPRQAPVYIREGVELRKLAEEVSNRLTGPEFDSLSNLSKISEFCQTKEIIKGDSGRMKSIQRLERTKQEQPYFINISGQEHSIVSRKGQKVKNQKLPPVKLENLLARFSANIRKMKSDMVLARSLMAAESEGGFKNMHVVRAHEKCLDDLWHRFEKQFEE
jgi:hypothetical protein